METLLNAITSTTTIPPPQVDLEKVESDEFAKEAHQLLASMTDVKITSAADLISVVYPLMKLAAKFKNMTGVMKKNIVISSLKILVTNSSIPSELKQSIMVAINVIIPPVIDEIYSFNLSTFKKMCSCCC
jgi:hypothetical protein